MAELTKEQALALAAARKRQMDQTSVIATTPDGGQVFRMPSGQLSFKSPGYATNDQDAIARIMEGATPLQEAQRTTDELTVAQHPIAARVQEFNQGAPLVGEWLDEAVGMVSPSAEKAMDQTSDAMERRYPGQSLGLNVAGGVAYTAPLALSGTGQKTADFVARGGSRVSQTGRAMGVGATAGGVEGASAGAGRSDDDRAGGAAVGFGVGMALGGTVAALAPLVGAGAKELVKRVQKLDVSEIAKQFGLSKPAARVVRGYLLNDDLNAASELIRRGGSETMLAESGPATRQALDTAMSTGGKALSTGRERVNNRVQSIAAGWQKTVNDVFGAADGGIKKATRDIGRKTAAARKAAYDYAYNEPTPVAGPAGRAIDDILSRLDPADLQKAISEANKEMRHGGYVNRNIMASVDDAGNVTFSQPLSVLQLDHIKRGLGNMIEAGTDPLTGKMSPSARRASELAVQLRDVLKDNVDGYARALKLGGDTIRAQNALSTGRRLLSENVSVEDVRTMLKDAPDDVVAAAQKGLRENLDAIMGRARTTIADLEAGNLDFATEMNQVAEAVAATRNLLTRNNAVKTRLVLGEKASKLFKELEKVSDGLVLRSAVAKNSATAIRQSGQQAMRDEVAPNLATRTVGNLGNPLDAAKEVTQTIMGIDARSLSDAEKGYFDEIADALTRIKGEDAQRALSAVNSAIKGQPIRDEQAELIGRLIAASYATAGYRAGTQYLAPR